jgi:hypothetical protein
MGKYLFLSFKSIQKEKIVCIRFTLILHLHKVEELLSKRIGKSQLSFLFRKKGKKVEFANYRGIYLSDIAVILFTMVLLQGFQAARDRRTRENQFQLYSDKECSDLISPFSLIMQQHKRSNLPLIFIFIDYIAALNSAERQTLWKTLHGD